MLYYRRHRCRRCLRYNQALFHTTDLFSRITVNARVHEKNFVSKNIILMNDDDDDDDG